MKKLSLTYIVNQGFYCLLALSLISFYLSSNNILILLLLGLYFIFLFKKSIFLFLSFMLLMILMIFNYRLSINKLYMVENKDIIKCKVYTLPKKNNYQSFYCKTNDNRYLVYSDNNIKISIGDYITIKGSKELVKNNSVPNQFNYAKYLQARKIAYLINADFIKVVGKSKRIDHYIINKIQDYYKSSSLSDYLLSFIIGDKVAFDDDFRDNTHLLNISYLFVVSGFHVGFLYFLIMFILKYLRISKETSKIITYTLLIFFLIINLFSVSIFRAISLLFGIDLKNRLKLPINNVQILSIIACINIIINPFSLQNSAFILSYLITLVLFISRDLFSKYNSFIFNFYKINFIAQLFSLPIIANFNFSYNFLSLVVSPFLNLYYTFVIFPLTIFNLVFKSIGDLTIWFFDFYELLLKSLASITFFNFNIGYFSTFRFILYYFLLIQILKKCERKQFSYLCTIFILITTFFYHKITLTENITFIDVGQGDSIYVESDFSRCKALIDTGGSYYYHPGENVANYLKSIQTSKIDILFITHSDIDHAGDYKVILNQVKVETIVFNYYDDSELQREIEEYARSKKINILKVKAYNRVDCGNLSFLIINPLEKNNTINDNSLVLFLLFNGDSYLFMGDADSKLISVDNISMIDFLKVSHHGSKYQTNKEFLDSITVNNAIISVGKNNYNHPAKELLNLLYEKNIVVYRTDLDGTISVKYYLRKKRIIYLYKPII